MIFMSLIILKKLKLANILPKSNPWLSTKLVSKNTKNINLAIIIITDPKNNLNFNWLSILLKTINEKFNIIKKIKPSFLIQQAALVISNIKYIRFNLLE